MVLAPEDAAKICAKHLGENMQNQVTAWQLDDGNEVVGDIYFVWDGARVVGVTEMGQKKYLYRIETAFETKKISDYWNHWNHWNHW